MAEILIMPRLTDTMEEGVVASIFVKEGDKVKSGDLLAEIETDKAVMEWESFVEGEVLYIGVSEGEGVPVNDPVLILGKKGEDISDLKAKFGAGNNGSSQSSQKEETPKVEKTEPKKEESKKEEPQQEKTTTKKLDTSSINAVVIRMRKMTDTMEEGVLASWLVKVGDKLKSGDVIAEVETDKATMDFDIYDDGEVLYLAAEEGDSVPIDAPIAVIGEKGADYKALLDADGSSSNSEGTKNTEEKQEQTKQEVKSNSMSSSSSSSSSNGNSEGRVFISPLAKKMAEDNGYDINQIEGSGENGRITKKDIESFTPQKATESKTQAKTETKQVSDSQSSGQPAQKAAPAFAQEGTRDEKVSQMRKAIAKSLSASKFTAPHFYLTIAVDMDKAIETRKMLNGLSETKISFNDIVIKSTSLALKKHPAINASWQGDFIRYNDNVHMGVAVAVDEGLLVPVVRFAEMKTLSQINTEVKDFAGKAKDKKLQPSDWEGSTFTISNLGMFGIEEFTAIINAPNACILAVGAIVEQPVVKNGEIVVGNVMKMTLSCDHRVVDGAVGAAFLQTLKEYMENPLKMLV